MFIPTAFTLFFCSLTVFISSCVIIVCFYSSFFISDFCSIVFSTLVLLYIHLFRANKNFLLIYLLTYLCLCGNAPKRRLCS